MNIRFKRHIEARNIAKIQEKRNQNFTFISFFKGYSIFHNLYGSDEIYYNGLIS